MKVPKKRPRDWLEPDEVMSLLDAAEQIDNPVRPETDRKAQEVRRLRDREKLTIKQIAEELEMSEGGVCWLYERRRVPIASQRRAIVAMLAASGTRNTELCRLRWQDLDFSHGKIRVQAARTNEAYARSTSRHRSARSCSPTRRASATSTLWHPCVPDQGRHLPRQEQPNRRAIAPIQRAAGKLREEHRLAPLPTGLSAHVFRRTYATLTLEVCTRVSDSQDRATLGRTFDDLMAGACQRRLARRPGYRELPTISDTNPTPDSTTVDDVGGER